MEDVNVLKECKKCKQIKLLELFYPKLDNLDKHSNICIECWKIIRHKYDDKRKDKTKLYKRQYRLNNKAKIKEGKRKHYLINKEKIAKANKEWAIKNKNKINQYQKQKRRTDINYRIRRYLRTRIRGALKQNWKAGSAVKDLGCTIQELKLHIERQFLQDMNWDNYGKWHIDHIKPLAMFDLSDRQQFLQACNYTNLQPLWAKDNLSKGCKIV